ncbi:hypothetical protein LSH36_222g03051 [Paralvinella palmiformis]|uniref:Uncharacterized protein n=1 Tax=Paralvinella palmiformis TaxID=53620 RepID=A0AAD9N5E0_9ANNE|nr:hypothetical protein LSH36_222g03051 [Paralvinella palmiformis]
MYHIKFENCIHCYSQTGCANSQTGCVNSQTGCVNGQRLVTIINVSKVSNSEARRLRYKTAYMTRVE